MTEAAVAGLRLLVAQVAAMDAADRRRLVEELPVAHQRTLLEQWPVWAHQGQLPASDDWRVWLIRAGRGFGKTRAGAEWVSAVARRRPDARIALVGATMDDVHKVMVEGQSGLLAVARHDEPTVWRSSLGELTFASGARAFVYSSERPEKLRGPEHHVAWCDELAKWRQGEPCWDNLMMGLRLGERSQVLVTTTPRPTMLMRRVMALPGLIESRGGTRDNAHLPADFRAQIEALYAGTRLGRQELDGELLEDVEGALWNRALLDRQRVRAAPTLVRIVVGVDPPASRTGDACGMVVAGRCANGQAWVLEDASEAGLTPEGWAARVAALVARYDADRVVVERNQGGDMVETVLRLHDASLPLHGTHASKGKGARAEPVSFLYAQGRVWHVGGFASLEDELCGLTLDGYHGPGRSPDRADALVWALWALMIAPERHVGLRRI